jgi:hypothetical protein
VFDKFRNCRVCGFRGYMDWWYRKSLYPLAVSALLLLLGVIPGVVFIARNRRKLICPHCGAIRV